MRGSPSLVGRGIANPMSAMTRGFKSPSPRYKLCGNATATVMGSGPANSPPTTRAGFDRAVQQGETVALSGTAADPDLR